MFPQPHRPVADLVYHSLATTTDEGSNSSPPECRWGLDSSGRLYGSVINFPTTSVTSIFARALTTGGGGGSYTLPQATESTLGGVQGATAVQALSTSGTTPLGWSINRARQTIQSALPTMTQTDIDNATTGRKAVTGALIADNAGGGSSTFLDLTDTPSAFGAPHYDADGHRQRDDGAQGSDRRAHRRQRRRRLLDVPRPY